MLWEELDNLICMGYREESQSNGIRRRKEEEFAVGKIGGLASNGRLKRVTVQRIR